MKAEFVIAASILSADFARLGEEAQAVLAAGADTIHFDVMDNHYVPNLTIGPLVCRALRNFGIDAPIDVHLMVEPVDALIENFAKAGATYISFHPEASKHVDRSLQLIRDLGCKSALALNPATSLKAIEHVSDKMDMLLLMSVNPGFGGQPFIPQVYKKIAAARHFLDQMNLPVRLQVDGGIKVNNIAQVAQAGADTFVVGSEIFQKKDYRKIMSALRQQLIV